MIINAILIKHVLRQWLYDTYEIVLGGFPDFPHTTYSMQDNYLFRILAIKIGATMYASGGNFCSVH